VANNQLIHTQAARWPPLPGFRQKLTVLSVLFAALISIFIQSPSSAQAAGATVINNDRNFQIDIQDSADLGDHSILLFNTRPVRGQAHLSEECSLNFFILDLQVDLENLEPNLLIENFCHFSVMATKVLSNGDVVIVAGDQVETWRPGSGKVSEWSLRGIEVLTGGGQTVNQLDVARNGKLVVVKSISRKRGDVDSASGTLLGLSAAGKTTWQTVLQEPGVLLSIMDVWAAEDGGALLHIEARAMSGGHIPGADAPEGAVTISQNRLYRVSPDGELPVPIIIGSMTVLDMSNPLPPFPDMSTDPAGYQAEFKRRSELTKSEIYTAGNLLGHPRSDGATDVMLGHNSGRAHFFRIGRDGKVLLDIVLDEIIATEGLRNWVDFSASEKQIILFGSIGTKKDRLSQGAFSWIEIPGLEVETRYAPLDSLGLEAVKSAGDEQLQYLDHNPTHRVQLLASRAGLPVAVSLVYRSRRQAIQIDEGHKQLTLYTETRDQHMAQVAKKERRNQRKAEREARKESINTDMAKSIGVSDKEFAAMSNREKKEAMVRSGDMNALMEMAAKQSQPTLQQMAQQQAAQPDGGQGGIPADMQAQMAAAFAAAGIDPSSIPGMQIAVPGTVQAAKSTSSASSVTSKITAGIEPDAGNILPVDSSGRGYIEFENADEMFTTLVIFNRKVGTELLKKDYEDGSIYEYIDFSRFNLPLDHIGVIFRDLNQQTLADLTPAVVN
jgi:hypothetical protein